jgi:acetyl esterase/lipase
MGRRGLALLGAGLLASGCAGSTVTTADSREYRAPELLNRATHGPGGQLSVESFGIPGACGAPVVVFFPGGAWQEIGDDIAYRTFCRWLAGRGALVVLAQYRVAPEVRFPTFLDDCASAVAHAARTAEGLGGDPARLILAGHSAGAYNAMLLANEPARLQAVGVAPEQVCGTIGISGPYTSDLLRHWSVAEIFQGHTDAQIDARLRMRADSPPALLVTGGLDMVVPPREGRLMAEAIRAAGGKAELVVLPLAGHLGTMASGPWLPPVSGTLDACSGFLRSVAAMGCEPPGLGRPAQPNRRRRPILAAT